MKWRPSPAAEAALSVLLATVVVVGIAWPLLFTSEGLAGDWLNHLWELSRQTATIRREHLPSLFLQDGHLFVPLFAFYGGTLYALVGALGVLLGGASRAYVAAFTLALAAAYGGWYWLARLAGVRRWAAHAPAIVFVCSAYYLTLVYSRGDWAEFVAISMVPLVLAAAISIVTAERLRPAPAVALGLGTVLLFGSHNITMLWTTTLGILLAGGLLICVPPARVRIARGAVLRAAAVLVPAALVNAWYLFPGLAYGFDTAVAHGNGQGLDPSLRTSQHLVAAPHLFALSHSSHANQGFVVALPVLAIVWVLVGLALCLRGEIRGGWRRALIPICGLTLVVAVLMTHLGLLLHLPRPYRLVQFGYRLDSYVTLGVAAAMVALLAGARGRERLTRIWLAGLVVVLIVTAAGAVQQIGTRRSVLGNRDVVVTRDQPLSYYRGSLPYWYHDNSLPTLDTGGLEAVSFASGAVRRERAAFRLDRPPGLLATNLTGTRHLLSVTGASIAGVDGIGVSVLRLARAAGNRPIVRLHASSPAPVVLGRLVTLAALLAWLVGGAVGFARARSAERPRRSLGIAVIAAAPLLVVLAGAASRPSASAAPVPATVLTTATHPAAITACLQRRGLIPGPTLRVASGGYERVEVRFTGGGHALVFLYPTAGAAVQRGGGLIRLHGVRRGRSIVLFSDAGAASSPSARALASCLPV